MRVGWVDGWVGERAVSSPLLPVLKLLPSRCSPALQSPHAHLCAQLDRGCLVLNVPG